MGVQQNGSVMRPTSGIKEGVQRFDQLHSRVRTTGDSDQNTIGHDLKKARWRMATTGDFLKRLLHSYH
jgi:hypothetical protein